MNTPELHRLYRRSQRYANFARHYRAILKGLSPAARVPKAIPRGMPMAWYRARAEYYTARATDTHDLYWALRQIAEQQAWLALSCEGKLAKLRELGSLIERGKSMIHDPHWQFIIQGNGMKHVEDTIRDREADRDWLLAHV
jgi:hypothetical protein